MPAVAFPFTASQFDTIRREKGLPPFFHPKPTGIMVAALGKGLGCPSNETYAPEEVAMLVTFRTPAYADIMMFGDIAVQLLKLMGHSGTVPGALLAEDIPEALDRLKKAIAAQPAAVPEQEKKDRDDEEEEEEEDKETEPPVSLAHRALPLIELLTAAAAARCDVLWDR